jgi:hypothetical protein
MRFVQDVELGDATWPKLALLYWICRRSDKGRDRGRIRAVLVILVRGELPRFENSQNVKMNPSVRLQRFENSRSLEMTGLAFSCTAVCISRGRGKDGRGACSWSGR